MMMTHAPTHAEGFTRTRRTGRLVAAATALALVTAGAVSLGAPATAAEPTPQAWTDDFDSATLDARWKVTNEVPSAWSLGDGALTLASQAGDTWQTANSAKNVFMVDIPAGDFTAVAKLSGPVSKVYQGAGLIAWKDMDNYVRAGLTYVGSLSPSARAIETDAESGGTFAALDFEDRPASTSETIQLQRVGDTVTTSYWDGTTWVLASSTTVSFDMTAVGLYALAAQDGTSHTVAFDSFGVTSAAGADLTPTGPFTLHPDSGPRYLVEREGVLAFTADRPTSVVGLVPTDAGDGAITLRTRDGDLPVVAADGHLVLGMAGGAASALRITDAGGGKLHLRLADGSAWVGLDGDGLLTLGSDQDAVALTIEYQATDVGKLDVDGDATSVDISKDLYGIFYEDINYAADGGLYAELVRNRSFEFSTADNSSFTGLTAWEVLKRGAGSASTGVIANDSSRLNATNRNYLRLDATGAGAGVRNAGYNTGVPLTAGQTYDFSVWARSSTAQTLTVQVEDAAGAVVFATGTVDVDGSDTWKKYSVSLPATATTTAGRLAVIAGAASTLRLDMVSLFPDDTWVGPVNGKSPLRKDLADKIEALNPSFLRFPGGCVTNVGTFDTYVDSNFLDRRRTYQWKETLGPVEQRATNWNFWGYNQSYGIGYLEYFEFAEDLGATPLPVLSVGANGCGSTIPEMKDDASIARWVQDTVDLIEFANGDVTTTWGAVRAELGHPKPFGLRYIGLGNEENTTTFEANFPKFRDAIAVRYPDVKILSNSGPDDSGARFDTLWAFNKKQKVDLVDEHYYNDPSWFLANNDRYDSYDRSGPDVFLGEYASKGNTMWNALSEASYMTGLERNSDVVKLASYAPLLANEDYVQWSPDAIWYDNDESWGSVNYYVQKLFATNVGDQVVPSTYAGPAPVVPDLKGGVFLSTWSTSAAYDNVKVTSNDGGATLFEDAFTDASKWQRQTGTWAVTNGEYVQSSTSVTDARSIVTDAYAKDWSDYTLELDARKISGSEGFLVGFAAGAPNNFFWWNLGGWNNTRSVLQKADGGSANEVKAIESSSITTGKTYKVKVVVDGRNIKLYLDGGLQIDYTDELPTTELYQVVTRDQSTGDLLVKVVNTADRGLRTQVAVSDVEVASTGTATEMVGNPSDMNTKADKTKIVPVERELTGLSNEFTYDFPAYSITFLRLHTADTAAPTITSLAASGTAVNGYLASPATVVAKAADDRGVDHVEVAIDGGAWVSTDGSTASVQVTGNGTHEVRARAVDESGNTSAERSLTVKVDAAAPVSQATVDPTARTVALRAADDGSGVARIEYRVGASGAFTAYTKAVVVGAAQTTVQFRAVDGVGNVESTGSVVVPKAGVVLAPSSTVALAPASLAYGKAGVVTVRVTGAGGTPTGTVRVLDGSTQVGRGTLASGRASVKLTSSLKVGTHRLTVVYGGDARFSGSSDVVTVKVVKASSTTRATLSPTKVRTTTKAKVTATVSTSTGVKATGKVTVTVTKAGKKVTARTATLSSKGTASTTLPRLKAGTYKVTVTYAGSAGVASSTRTVTLTVRR
ncbi:alpha-L-arabinofuranosidase C-terminal domain-containing protein [Cellulomonas rhizosphaerae]|uniref:non-reducing end alpha-L-arabinofuranosidase n=1 Tax=Cellulomonas rhizosphaerae TaxID=2293719 RepID=A0A413RIB5_9CELL|nr:alpha-L-arabinofuranosidase C-terminal domain-containing protein [Cellulomonas rhizosphaerae]RHA38020.1 DUF1349 domain-containing protein [Cellulomonas rhizosphaerae]